MPAGFIPFAPLAVGCPQEVRERFFLHVLLFVYNSILARGLGSWEAVGKELLRDSVNKLKAFTIAFGIIWLSLGVFGPCWKCLDSHSQWISGSAGQFKRWTHIQNPAGMT